MNWSRVTLFSFALRHFGRFSSYHQLLRYAGGCRTMDVAVPLANILRSSWHRKLGPRWRRLSEWRLRPVFVRRERQCVHYLHPGDTLFHGHKWKGRHGLVLTLHAPAAWIREAGEIKSTAHFEALKKADRVIVLSTDSVAGYEEFCCRRRMVVIPHGVDVHFFRPPAMPKHKPLVLTVGNWLRDYEFWAEAALRLAAANAGVEFAVVAAPPVVAKVRAKVEGIFPGRIRFLSELSDEKLREIYQQAAVVFIPLTGATANNAIVESWLAELPWC